MFASRLAALEQSRFFVHVAFNFVTHSFDAQRVFNDFGIRTQFADIKQRYYGRLRWDCVLLIFWILMRRVVELGNKVSEGVGRSLKRQGQVDSLVAFLHSNRVTRCERAMHLADVTRWLCSSPSLLPIILSKSRQTSHVFGFVPDTTYFSSHPTRSID